VQKKEKDREHPANFSEFSRSLFFGQLIAWPPLHALLLFYSLCDFVNRAANRLRLVLLSDLWFSDAL
jgi:hypothetical protein